MKRLALVFFILVAIGLVFFSVKTETEETSENIATRAKTVIPVSSTEQAETDTANTNYTEDFTFISLIPLKSDETLINTLGIDFDGDGYDDQINAIRKVNNPYITLLIGLYNPFRAQYTRTEEIQTEIIQTQTFSYTCMDIIGNHTNALIYNGFAENGDSIMQIYLPQRNDSEFILSKIGDFKSDGSIFIQQLDRYDSYETQQATGISYPVWVYSTDASRGGNTLDQLQTMYVWDQDQKQFVKSTENRVTETKVASKELNRIQDGTVETFSNHLEGLWYKTSSTSDQIRFIFFNPSEEEIIFQTEDSQEVYTWVSSTIRRNGIYLSAVNSSINNLTRRIDISLTGIDEIKIRNQDDVRMSIKESNLWDGQYKKQTSKNALLTSVQQEKNDIQKILEEQKKWLINNKSQIEFINGTYLYDSETGRTAVTYCNNNPILQIQGAFFKHETYLATIEKDDKGNISTVKLTPAKLTPTSIEPTDMAVIVLEAVKETD